MFGPASCRQVGAEAPTDVGGQGETGTSARGARQPREDDEGPPQGQAPGPRVTTVLVPIPHPLVQQ